MFSCRNLATTLLASALLSTACLAPLDPEEATDGTAEITAEGAEKFVLDAEKKMMELRLESNKASWVKANFITEDTQYLEALASEKAINAGVEYAKKAFAYDNVKVSPELRRKLELLKLGLTMPAPNDPEKSRELATIATRMDAAYGEGKYCPTPDKCFDINDATEVLAKSRDPKELLAAWEGWHSVGAPIRKDYLRFVELSNEGAKELGFADTGAMWRNKYDMPADDFAKEMDRLWTQVKPLYTSLHCYVRGKLVEKYGSSILSENGEIPAHLLGNIWAQDWSNIYDIVAPQDAGLGYDVTKLLLEKKVDDKELVRYGERFFTSLGFAPLPETFWQRSLFLKPADRNVVCHASAWDLDDMDDIRIKMCININEEDFRTVHHELGHNFYQRSYKNQSLLFRDSANDGFHEAVGDTIALSITPAYLVKAGLLPAVPENSSEIGYLMQMALDKIAFLPFGLLVDQWRWKVFSGEVTPENYNKAWWELRRKYQGVKPPTERGESFFDPAAKYHVAGNVPYSRYFLASILQFQFHRALCRIAGQTGSISGCSIYGNKEAGAKLDAMLSMGASRPWQDALEALSGERQMDATAILDYFAPLQKWLDAQNKGKTCGW